MRRIGGFSDSKMANQFGDYLQTLQIAAKVDHDEDAHDIWVRDERDVAAARSAMEEFKQSPGDAKFDVSAEAARIRKENEAELQRKIALQNKARQKLRGGAGAFSGRSAMSGGIPVVIGMILLCVGLAVATNFSTLYPELRARGLSGREIAQWVAMKTMDPGYEYSTRETLFYGLSVVDVPTYYRSGDAWVSMKQGQIWRLITPAFLHGSPMHLVFNMMALFTLGSVVERLHGRWFLIGLLVVSQIVGCLTQILLPDEWEYPLAIGASGAIFGVFGFVWIRPKVEPSYPVRIPPFNVYLMLGFLVACMTPLIPNIANGGHVGGLVTGIAVAYLAPKTI